MVIFYQKMKIPVMILGHGSSLAFVIVNYAIVYTYIYIYIYIYLYPTEAILQRHLQYNISDIRQVLGNNYLLGSYSPVQCLIW